MFRRKDILLQMEIQLLVLVQVFVKVWCDAADANWTTWINTDRPYFGKGDDETVATIRKRSYDICQGRDPVDARCRIVGQGFIFNSRTIDYLANKLRIPCTNQGLMCVNDDQIISYPGPACSDYEIQFLCPSKDANSVQGSGDISIIAIAAGLSVILPIMCVIGMHLCHHFRRRRLERRGLTQTGSGNEQESVAIQTDYNFGPPRYSQLFGPDMSPSTLIHTAPSLTSVRTSVTHVSDLGHFSHFVISNSSESSVDGNIYQISHGSICDTPDPSIAHGSQSRFPGMHISILERYPDTPTEQTTPIYSTPPPSYSDALVFLQSIDRKVVPDSQSRDEKDSQGQQQQQQEQQQEKEQEQQQEKEQEPTQEIRM
ncbi:hypothetical protein CHS0354_003289 [Potamilus streckersoni]|uniref:WxxW domain-containing protein n=1 Tax=Potamilus streckersoni TaxID=2493646 RepID=A0AAE0SV43_9BIVA|nr:hypothetical protein CHS0354_003289 [Potamilus streckersoni]